MPHLMVTCLVRGARLIRRRQNTLMLVLTKRACPPELWPTFPPQSWRTSPPVCGGDPDKSGLHNASSLTAIQLKTKSNGVAYMSLRSRVCSASQEPVEKVNEKPCNVNEGFAEKFTGKGPAEWRVPSGRKYEFFTKMAIMQEIYKKNKHEHHFISQIYVKFLARNVKNAIFRLTF